MARVTSLPTVGPRDHAVQFYGADEELAVTVGGYLAKGLLSGDGILVVATAPHPARVRCRACPRRHLTQRGSGMRAGC